MIPAATKVLSKVSPSSRLNSISSGGGGKDAKAAAAAQGAKPGLEKPSPYQQRLIGQGVCSSDEQGLWEAASGPEGAGAAPLPGMDALHYFGVFDGHGGADAARHCAQRMHQVRAWLLGDGRLDCCAMRNRHGAPCLWLLIWCRTVSVC
jgi:hypothetical protein